MAPTAPCEAVQQSQLRPFWSAVSLSLQLPYALTIAASPWTTRPFTTSTTCQPKQSRQHMPEASRL